MFRTLCKQSAVVLSIGCLALSDAPELDAAVVTQSLERIIFDSWIIEPGGSREWQLSVSRDANYEIWMRPAVACGVSLPYIAGWTETLAAAECFWTADVRFKVTVTRESDLGGREVVGSARCAILVPHDDQENRIHNIDSWLVPTNHPYLGAGFVLQPEVMELEPDQEYFIQIDVDPETDRGVAMKLRFELVHFRSGHVPAQQVDPPDATRDLPASAVP
jgi:hypothetical protein